MKDQERVPLRVVLRNFLNHIENLESQSCPEKSYEAEFQDLKIFSENVKSLKEYSCLEGEKEVNRKKNRYKDILPFDVSRVVLNEYAGIPGSDYINANFIKGASGSPAYIASQGPLPSTVNDFWRMVVQCEVQVIVMACNEEEAGKAKCEKYWVDDGEEKQFGMISVKLLKSSTVCPDFSVRTMRLKYSNNQSVIEERTVCQLHYVAWPDHGVPTVVQPLLDMVRLVRDTQASETLPVLVHCSAGCGRTGTICAIDYVWGLLRTGKLTSDFSLLSLIREMRKQRIAMVQTKEQYVLVHQAVRELFKEQLCMIDSHPYENVDPNGLLIIKEEENTYDCIEFNSKNYLEEKNDNKEKEMLPPPLPSKRNTSKFPSKYEKEVENLSAQQRSMNYMTNVRSFHSHGYPNDKKKIKNEYDNNYEKINKKVSDNQTKSESNKPIPSKGILRVPQLETVAPKCSTTIKRSKSLKVVSNCDKNTLSFCQNSPTENKRRSSLESNFDEHYLDSDCSGPNKTRIDLDPLPIEQKKKNVSQLVSKYDIIMNHDHKTFIRSLTSLDMRQKLLYNNSNSILSSFDDNLAKQKCKLLRSNTQINVLKRNHTTFCQLKNSPQSASSVDSFSSLKTDCHTNFPHNKVNQSATSLENLIDQNLKIRPKLIGCSTPTTKHLNLMKSSSGKDVHLKDIDQSKPHSYQKLESSRVFKDTSRVRSGNNSKPERTNNLRYEDLYDCYTNDKAMKLNVKQDKYSIHGLKPLNSHSKKDVPDTVSSSFDSSKYMRAGQLKLLRSQKKVQLNKTTSIHKQKQDSSLCIQSSSKGTYNSCRPFKEDLPRNRNITSGHEDFPSNSNHIVKEDYSQFTDHKSNPLYNDHFMVDESSDDPGIWERDNSRIQMNFSKPPYNSAGYMVTRSRGQSLLSKSEESKDIPRRLESEVDSCRNKSIPIMIDHYEELNSDQDLTAYDVSFSKEGIPVQPNEIKYILQNRRNIRLYNSSVHTSRHKNVLAPSICPEASSSHISRTSKTATAPQRSIDGPSFSQDTSYFSSEIHRNYNDCFHSAPGVDLDQVAASITKDDENLMKVTLEELQVRKTKLQMAPKGPPKGATSSVNSGDKKKQQQYL